jgi:hypothetical protein
MLRDGKREARWNVRLDQARHDIDRHDRYAQVRSTRWIPDARARLRDANDRSPRHPAVPPS